MWALTSQASLPHGGVGFLELDLAVAGGLDLGAGQHQAGLEPLQQEIVVAGLAVVAQNLDFGSTCRPTFALNAAKPRSVNPL